MLVNKNIFIGTFVVFFTMAFFNCMDNPEYKKAVAIFNSSDPQKHKKALNILRELQKKTIESGEYVKNRKFSQKIEDDYSIRIRKQFAAKYSNTRIAFIDENLKLFTISLDGKDKIHIKKASRIVRTPKWSPEGTHIAFISSYPLGYQIYVIDKNGANIKDVAQIEQSIHLQNPDFSWSPDSKKIIFERQGHLYTVNIHTKKERLIFPRYVSPIDQGAYFPVWLKNDKDILFVHKQKLQLTSIGTYMPRVFLTLDKFVSKKQTLNPNEKLINMFTMIQESSLSNNGTKLAVNVKDIFIIDIKTKSVERFVRGSHPSWSPDDKYIIYHSFGYNSDLVERPRGLYVLPVDQNERVCPILIYAGDCSEPSWSPILK